MIILILLLIAVCFFDYRSRRIPNILIALLLLLGILYHYHPEGGLAGIQNYLLKCTMIALVSYPLFRIGAIGAGDCKLFAVCSGFFEFRSLLSFLFCSWFIAAVFSLIKMMKARNFKQRFTYFLSYLIEVKRSGHWEIYIQNAKESRTTSICFSGPILISLCIHVGGVF
ncbi:MAG: prepilin peptidase [Clostridium sp.]|nr:prepilin peptidase [Clostridium sp.]